MASYVLNIACSPYNSFEKRNIRVQIHCAVQGELDDSDSSSTEPIDTKVFAYRRINDEYFFDHVCSTVDMVEYPILGKEANGESAKWCRSDTVDILVRTLSIAQDFIYNVKSDVKMLYMNMCAHNTVVGTEAFTIGDMYELDVHQNSEPIEIDIIPVGYECKLAQPSNGGVLSLSGGRLYYAPKVNTFGKETFSYTLINTENRSTTYTYLVHINNDANKGFVQLADTTVNTSVMIDYNNDVAADIRNPDGKTLLGDWLDATLEWTLNVYPYTTRHGTIFKRSDTSLEYKPKQDYVGEDDFDYNVTDGERTAVIHCTVTING